jgi:hypothetical protein
MVRTAERKKATRAAAKRTSGKAGPRVIARKYLSPGGIREISSKRLTEAIKAVKDAHASNDGAKM